MGAHNIRYTVATEMWETAIAAEKERLKHATAASAIHYGNPHRFQAAKPARPRAERKEFYSHRPRAVRASGASGAAQKKSTTRAAAVGGGKLKVSSKQSRKRVRK